MSPARSSVCSTSSTKIALRKKISANSSPAILTKTSVPSSPAATLHPSNATPPSKARFPWESKPKMGKVYLIGAGPRDPDLLTVKAPRLLQRATIVLHDSLVSREVLRLIPREAEIIDVGKRAGQKLLTQDEINHLLIFHAGSGRSLDRSPAGPPDPSTAHHEIIRRKGGDPVVFGRAGEEIEALRRANIRFEIVPGITAALGAAAAAGISLTDRRAASQIVITTYSRGSDQATADPFAVTPNVDWAAVSSSTTLVLYMPGADYAEVS